MKTMNLVALAVAIVLLAALPAQAQYAQSNTEVKTPNTAVLSGAGIGAGLGAALCILGAGMGFGRIGSSALESMARQPEVAGRVQTAMIIIAALLEGATFFALLICIQLAGKIPTNGTTF